jgi:Leucine-rich repeat (LRR) protein
LEIELNSLEILNLSFNEIDDISGKKTNISAIKKFKY